MNNFISKNNVILLLLLSFVFTQKVYSQDNGNNLVFQGLEGMHGGDAVSYALGESFTGRYGTLSSIYYNPAGLSGISHFSVSVTADYNSFGFRKNNVWYPGSPRLNLSLLLDGLLVMNEDQSGMWASELVDNRNDHAWELSQFKQPKTGYDPYDSEVADFDRTKNKFNFSNIAVAVPFNIGNYGLTAGLTYGRDFIYDLDWNGTHLDPHFSKPGNLEDPDTLRSIWSIYNRSREGTINTLSGVLSIDVFDELSFGVKGNYLFGETDDMVSLDRIGTIHLENVSGENDWSFTFGNNQYVKTGTSNFSSFSLELGTMLKLEKFSFGLQFTLPKKISREWDYSTVLRDSIGSTEQSNSAEDEIELPYKLSIGAGFKPIENLTFLLDYSFSPLSETKITAKSADSSLGNQKYVDQRSFAAGVEYIPLENLFFRLGYRNQSGTFTPAFNSVNDRGPIISTYSIGIGYQSGFGRFDITYLMNESKYYDAFLNNRNYTYKSNDRILITYSINLFSN